MRLKRFSITSSGQPKPDFSDQLSPFDTLDFNKLYRGMLLYTRMRFNKV